VEVLVLEGNAQPGGADVSAGGTRCDWCGAEFDDGGLLNHVLARADQLSDYTCVVMFLWRGVMSTNQFYVALILEAMWHLYTQGWSCRIVRELDRNGTRARWLDLFRAEIETALTLQAT
jgi:hypothetical protein